MEVVEKKYSDLQEITFWQQLNKQLIAKRKSGAPITDADQKSLQQFCFDNRLFHRISADPLFDELPIALVTDFERITTHTFYIEPWIECLMALMPNSICLDVEQALADAFVEMTDIDRKYHLLETTPADSDADDDEELFAFINEYNSMIEKQGRDLCNALQNLYELKAFVINKIDKQFGIGKFAEVDHSAITFNFSESPHRDQINSAYLQDFCKQALGRISKFTDATRVFSDMEIYNLLDRKEQEPGLKTSIREFIRHERQLLKRQSGLIDKFNNDLQEKLNIKPVSRIEILDLSSFAFLKSPFPSV